MKTDEKKTVFQVLNNLNVNGHTEKKKTANNSKELTYLSWPWAVGEVQKHFPDMTYEVEKFDGKPYLYDNDLGYMCFTKVTIEGQTKEMWLPVMNSANKAMKNAPYTYSVWNSYQKAYEEKRVDAATMFDINKTIMRCLTKNLAMFGLGLYIYSGEDLPEAETAATAEERKAQEAAAKAEKEELDRQYSDRFAESRAYIEGAKTRAELLKLHDEDYKDLVNYQPFRDALNARYKMLTA
jgi:hypothetical protein